MFQSRQIEFKVKLYVSERNDRGAAGVSTNQASLYTLRWSCKDLFPFTVTQAEIHTLYCNLYLVCVSVMSRDAMNSCMQTKTYGTKFGCSNKHFFPDESLSLPIHQACKAAVRHFGEIWQQLPSNKRKLQDVIGPWPWKSLWNNPM